MGGIGNLLKAPIAGVLQGVRDIIGTFHTSEKERLEAMARLSEIEADFRVKIAEADVEFAKAQAEVLKTEITSESWLGRNWRPLLMSVFGYIIAHNYVIVPVLTPILAYYGGLPIERAEIPPQMWSLLEVGIGGYVIGRSAEKIAPAVADAIKASRQK